MTENLDVMDDANVVKNGICGRGFSSSSDY